jgi:hypothetical protein
MIAKKGEERIKEGRKVGERNRKEGEEGMEEKD